MRGPTLRNERCLWCLQRVKSRVLCPATQSSQPHLEVTAGADRCGGQGLGTGDPEVGLSQEGRVSGEAGGSPSAQLVGPRARLPGHPALRSGLRCVVLRPRIPLTAPRHASTRDPRSVGGYVLSRLLSVLRHARLLLRCAARPCSRRR